MKKSWRRGEWRLGVILITYLTLAVAHALILPLSRGEDEFANFKYIQFIASRGRLPINYQERAEARYKSDWPALYHLTIAQVAGWANNGAPPQLKPINDDPRRRLVKDILRPTWLLHTEDELPPYRGEVLMWFAGRLLTTLMGLGTLIVTYYVVLEIFPQRKLLALSVVAFWAVMPRFLFTNSVLSEDSLLGLLMALFLYILIKIIKKPDTKWCYLTLGGLAGLAVTAKYSAVVVPLEIIIIYTFLARRQGWGWRAWLARLSLTGAAAMITASWWFIFIEWHFNAINELGLFAGLVKPVLAAGIDPTMQKAATFLTAGAITQSVPAADVVYRPPLELAMDFIKTFWSGQAVEQFSRYHLFQPYLHLAMTGIALLSLPGLWRIWRANRRNHRIWLGILILHSMMIAPIIMLRFLTQSDPGWAAQGRHLLFPAVPAIGALLVWGWSEMPLIAGRLKMTYIVISVLLVWSVAAQIFFPLTIYPARAPVRTVPEALDQVSHHLNIRFGDVIELAGFDVTVHPSPASLQLTLLWQALGLASEDYVIEVSLLAGADKVQRQLITHFGDGIYPSRVWDPGDIIRDEIGLPLVGLQPGEYRLQVSLIGADGALSTKNGGLVTLTSLTIGEFAEQAPGRKLEIHLDDQTVVSGFDIWRHGSVVPGNAEYHYRSTIPIVWYGMVPEDTDIRLSLIGPDGRIWLPERKSGPLSTFIVGPGWPSGEYTLQFELWQNETLLTTMGSPSVLSVRNEQRLVDPPAMRQHVEANFANRVMLVGYDLLSRRVKAGEGVSLVLYWKGLRTMAENFVFFTDLVDNQQKSWAKAERWPRDNYPTLFWAPEEIVVDAYELPIDPDIPDGIYHLQVGLYLPLGQAPLLLPLIQDGQVSSITSINLGPIKIGRPPLASVLAPQQIAPQIPLSIKLGQPPEILLRGYDFVQAHDTLQLRLYWERLSQTPVDWTTFVQVRDPTGAIVAQKDGPTGGVYPTSLWDVGEIVVDQIAVPLTALPDGNYSLFIGLYNLSTGERLPVPFNPADELLLIEDL